MTSGQENDIFQANFN